MGEQHSLERRVVAVLGDVVRSRAHASRPDLQADVHSALARSNATGSTIQPLTTTIGDEFQGLFDDVATALEATLRVRLALLPSADVRFGIGWGPLSTYDRERAPFEQDGPAWWAAREAVDRVRTTTQRREMPRGVRTWFQATDPEAAPLVATINAFLLCRDELVASMSAGDAETMLGLLDGEPPSRIADEQGVTVSAVSQRAIRGGLYAIRLAHERMREAMS